MSAENLIIREYFVSEQFTVVNVVRITKYYRLKSARVRTDNQGTEVVLVYPLTGHCSTSTALGLIMSSSQLIYCSLILHSQNKRYSVKMQVGTFRDIL